MDFDFKGIIKTIAPVAGALIGSPLAGMAIAAIADAIGVSEPTVEKVANAIQSGKLTGDQIVAARNADAALKVRLRELDLDESRIEADIDKAYLADTASARVAHAGNRDVNVLGFLVLTVFGIVCSCALYASYALLTGGMQIEDSGVIAAVFGLIGTILGYVSAKADQVISYFFGSTKDSRKKTEVMADAIANLPARLNQ